MQNDPTPPQRPFNDPTQYAPRIPPTQSPYERTQYAPPPAPYPQPSYEQTKIAPPVQYPQPPYIGQPPNTNMAPPPPKSRRRLWIILGSVSGVVLLLILIYALVSVTSTTLSGPSATATTYYQAVKDQDYEKAYSYLDTGSISVQGQQAAQNTYVGIAHLLDETKGKVTAFSISHVSQQNEAATITMSVTREGAPYKVQLNLKKIGNDWKITSMNGV